MLDFVLLGLEGGTSNQSRGQCGRETQGMMARNACLDGVKEFPSLDGYCSVPGHDGEKVVVVVVSYAGTHRALAYSYCTERVKLQHSNAAAFVRAYGHGFVLILFGLNVCSKCRT